MRLQELIYDYEFNNIMIQLRYDDSMAIEGPASQRCSFAAHSLVDRPAERVKT